MYIYFLKGNVADIDAGTVVMDCGGVGYECVSSSYTISKVKIGEPAMLYTYCSVREDAIELFGFATRDERSCFEQLISVNGVGPKAAIAILSVASPSAFRLAVLNQDEKVLTAASGVGKKLAQRILLELRDKVEISGTEAFVSGPIAAAAPNAAQSEAAAALSQLGYSQAEIAACLKPIKTETMTAEEIVKAALRSMMMK